MIVPWNAETARAIGADWLLAAIAPTGAFGRAARAGERPFLRGDEIAARAAIERIAMLARDVPAGVIAEVRATIARTPDVRAALARADTGATLDDVDFFEVQRFVDDVDDVVRLAEGGELGAHGIERVDAGLRRALEPGRTTSRTFYLADSFGSELFAARGEAARTQAAYDAARGRTFAHVAAALGRETLGGETFTVMRDALPATLPTGLRIVREAPTYLLCDVELDDSARAALVARDTALDAVANAEEAVRVRLSREIARVARALEATCAALGSLESALARVTFASKYACVPVELVDAPHVALDDVRYLPLVEPLERAGRAYRPLSFVLDGMGVVTGPNMGGKTAALRALGFACACATLGVPIPARAAALPLVDEIVWLGIGSLPSDDALLSAFGREVVDVRAFLERDATRALVLVDEFARTTSPREGRALVVALLETLRARGAFGFAATHFDAVAADANLPHFTLGARELPQFENVRLELDDALARIASVTDYRLTRATGDGPPYAGDALALAGALGLDPTLLARARAVVNVKV